MNSRVIVDTSVLTKWLNQTGEDNIDKADQIMQSALKGEIELIAPELAKYELGNVLLKKKHTILPLTAKLLIMMLHSCHWQNSIMLHW